MAIRPVTLKPGSWPPSPGLAPCATLISISRQLLRYSAVTPKRPEAICLIAEEALSPLARGLARAGSSPPSPLSRARADAVHGDRQRLMRLRAERAERDAGRDQPLADFGDALDLVDRDRRAAFGAEIQQVAQRDRRQLAHRLGVAAIGLIAVGGDGGLQHVDQVAVEGMRLAARGAACRCRRPAASRHPRPRPCACSSSTLRAMPERPMPEMRDCMPGKNSATSARDRPIASKL